MKNVSFFSTPVDIATALDVFERSFEVKYVLDGQQSTKEPEIIASYRQIDGLGFSTSESGGGSVSYLVLPKASDIFVRDYISKDSESFSEKRWYISNGDNQDSIWITPAGLWNDDVLLAGRVATINKSESAKSLMRGIALALKSAGFVKLKMWWVGPDAMSMLKSGRRLATTAIQSPSDYDLQLQ